MARKPPPEPQPEPGVVDRAIAALLGAAWRYKEEIAGVALVLAGALTALALAGAAGGTILAPWSVWLWETFGWGALAVPVLIAGPGAYVLWRELGGRPFLGLGRVIAAEVVFFALLPLLHLLTFPGNPAQLPYGYGGGIVGWALGLTLATLAGVPVSVILLALVMLAGLAVAAGLSREGLGLALVRVSGRLRRAAALPTPAMPRSQTGGRGDAPAVASATEPARRSESLRAAEQTASGPTSATRSPTGPGSSRAGGGKVGASQPTGAEKPEKPEKPEKRKARKAKDKPLLVITAGDDRPAKPKPRDERLPPLELLDEGSQAAMNEAELREKEAVIVQTLSHFGLPAKVVSMRQGPAVTQFGVEPGFVERPGADGRPRQHKVRVSQIASLADDLALALSAQSLRIEAPVPGHSYVGIEVPNKKINFVTVRSVLESEAFQKINSPLAIALGRDMSGAAVAADLAKMPHLLIAGTTGSGKSVCISAIITSLVSNNTPDDLRLVLIDPKMVELVRFNGLPHLLGRVENKLERIGGVLRWVTQEMDNRYKLFAEIQARHLADYNRKIGRRREADRLPHIVLFIDELADLMLNSPVETEQTLCRLAQMARATGIHLVVATQRPSTDVVTGLIKANFPARASFAVASSVDSRVILDTVGAETLLGRGDMLFLAPDASAPQRLQACLVTDKEIEDVVKFWKDQHEAEIAARAAELTAERRAQEGEEVEEVPPAEIESIPWESFVRAPAEEGAAGNGGDEISDDLLERALEVIQVNGRASASLLQRRLRLGYPRAARLMDELEKRGYIGGSVAGGRTRAVLRQDEDEE